MSLDLSNVYHLHRRELVNRLIRIVQCRDTAQDIVQESYLILARTALQESVDHPRGFLFRIATNLALDHLRHRQVIQQHEEVAQQEEVAAHPSAEAEVSAAEWRQILRQTIDELPPRCRDVFVLHKLHGMTYREVAELLDISQSAVEKHIIKGLMHCRSRLGKRFGHPPA